MIYIKVMANDNEAVDIRVDGILDSESLPVLMKVCERHWMVEKIVRLHLEGLFHISREGRDFIKSSQKITVVDPAKFV